MKATWLIALAVLFLVVAALASCGLLATHKLTNIRMATDETGKTPVTLYTPLQTFCVVADVSGIKPGALIRAEWIAASAQGVAPNTKINTSDYVYKSGVAHLYFKLATWDESSWPAGSYKVFLFVNGVQAGEQAFTVQ